MAKYNSLIDEMNACVEEGIGSPMKIKKKLDRMNNKLMDRGYTFQEASLYGNYAMLAQGALLEEAEKSGSDKSDKSDNEEIEP